MADKQRKGVTVTGPISFEIETALDGHELAQHVNAIIQQALEQRGIKYINSSLDVFDVWDPEAEQA